MNAVEVNDQEQFFEILCTHAIVDHNNAKMSVPRFTVYLVSENNIEYEEQKSISDSSLIISPMKEPSSEEAEIVAVSNLSDQQVMLLEEDQIMINNSGDQVELEESKEPK